MQRKTSTVVLGISVIATSLLGVSGPAGAQTAAAPPAGYPGAPTTGSATTGSATVGAAGPAPASAPTSAAAGPDDGAAQPIEPSITSLPIPSTITTAATSGAEPTSTATVTAPAGSRNFQTVGVTWRRGTGGSKAKGITVKVRTHAATGWTGWQALDLDEATLADAAQQAGPVSQTSAEKDALRDGTGSLYVGPSDGAEAQVSAAGTALPKDLRFDLIDAGSSDHDAGSASGVKAAATPNASATKASSTTSSTTNTSGAAEPTIFPRAEWGADEKMVRDTPTYMSTVKAAVLHHTAGPNGYSKAEVPAIIRGDYAFHVKSRGWDDIGYNALVDRFGRVWEGRAGGLEKNVMGAHAGGFNSDTFGVAVIGSYQYAHPSAALTTSLGRLFAWKLALNHRNPRGTAKLTSSGGGTARYRAGTTVTLPAIMGHRNTGYTECPGGNLYAKLGTIRKNAMAETDAGLINPVGAQVSVTLGDPVSITATALRDQTWKLIVTGPCGAGTVRTLTGRAEAGAKITATWDGRLEAGGQAPAGRYGLSLTSSSSKGAARPVTDDVLVVPPALPAETPATPPAGSGGYVPVTPARIYDTRDAGMRAAGPGGRAQISVLGKGGVPSSGVTAVVLNLTAQCVSNTTSLTVWPTGGTRSTLPLTAPEQGTTRSVLVTTQVGANGQVSVGNLTGVTQLSADVVGYYAAGGGAVRPIPSTRVLDTGTENRMTDETRTVTLPTTLGGVPSSSIRALLVDVGGVAADKSGTLTAHATGTSAILPGTTFAGATIADNLTIVPVTGGEFRLTATGGPVRAILDAEGIVLAPPGPGTDLTGSTLTAITPHRVLSPTSVAKGSPRKIVVTGGAVPSTATAVLVQLGGAAPAAGTTLQASAWGATPPGGTALRVPKGLTRGNLVLVPVGTEGSIALSTSVGSVRSSLDVYGYLS